MGHHLHLDTGKDSRLRFPAPLTVLASGEQLDALKTAKGAPWIENANLVQLELDQELAESHFRGDGILVVEVDPTIPASMERITQVRTRSPDRPLIVALASADVALVRTLVRQGVSDVVALPLQPEELLQAAIAVGEVRARQDEGRVDLAPLIAVTRGLGGGGATTLVTHLAAALAERVGSERVCILDLDLQFGRVSEVLGLQPRRTLADLLDANARVDGALLRSVAAVHSSGVSVVAAPHDIVPLEAVDADQLARIIDLVRREYDFVLVDLPSNLTHWNLSVLAEASSIVMVVEQSIASLRQARRRLDLFRSVGIDRRIVSVVVNRMQRRLFGTISLGDVEEALGHTVVTGLPAEDQHIGIAQDQGQLVSDVRAKSAYAADVGKLADILQRQFEEGRQLRNGNSRSGNRSTPVSMKRRRTSCRLPLPTRHRTRPTMPISTAILR